MEISEYRCNVLTYYDQQPTLNQNLYDGSARSTSRSVHASSASNVRDHRPELVTFVPENERKFHGTKVPWNFLSFTGSKVPTLELSFPGTKVPRYESSIIKNSSAVYSLQHPHIRNPHFTISHFVQEMRNGVA